MLKKWFCLTWLLMLGVSLSQAAISNILIDFDGCLYSKRGPDSSDPTDEEIRQCLDEISSDDINSLCALHGREELRGEIVRNSVHDAVFTIMRDSLVGDGGEDVGECGRWLAARAEAASPVLASTGPVSLSPVWKVHDTLSKLNDTIMQAATTHARIEAWSTLAGREASRRRRALERAEAALAALPPDVSNSELVAACRPMRASGSDGVTYSDRCYELTTRGSRLYNARAARDRARTAHQQFSSVPRTFRRLADQSSEPYTDLLWLRRCFVGHVRGEGGADDFARVRAPEFFDRLTAVIDGRLADLQARASNVETRGRRMGRRPNEAEVAEALTTAGSGAAYDEADDGIRSGESADCDQIMAQEWDGAWSSSEGEEE
ncbi:MAG: hypothetical protein HYT79_06815 [Elusimicrobia bacterium]|nr:hypothetical protein [Elusimicrobiota bacterium]